MSAPERKEPLPVIAVAVWREALEGDPRARSEFYVPTAVEVDPYLVHADLVPRGQGYQIAKPGEVVLSAEEWEAFALYFGGVSRDHSVNRTIGGVLARLEGEVKPEAANEHAHLAWLPIEGSGLKECPVCGEANLEGVARCGNRHCGAEPGDDTYWREARLEGEGRGDE